MFELITRLSDRFESSLYFLRDSGSIGRELFKRGVPGAERLQLGRPAV